MKWSQMKQRYKNLKTWQRWALELTLIILIIWSVRLYQQQEITTGPAPIINGITIDNKTIDWQSYQGKPLLVHFWASWCPICSLEEGSIESISKDYAVLSIASWTENTKEHMQKQSLSFATIDDPEGYWAEQYGINAVPASFIINADGIIEFVETGYTSEIGLRLRLWWIQFIK